MDKYEFNPEDAFNRIMDHWNKWAASVGAKKWVIGISGGKDSTVVAALAARIFGKESVLGVMMPNNMQSDIKDSREVCEFLGIQSFTVNIHNAYKGILDEVCTEVFEKMGLPCNDAFRGASYDTTTNLPARLRMCTLYAIAQTIGGMVLNTCNLSEDTVGYSTLGGDNMGSYAPIQGLTVTEIRQLGDWIGLPNELVHKTPVDGLQSKTDEEKLGFSYANLDRYIREDVGTEEFKARINEMYRKNKFKTDMVHIVGPDFDYLGNFVRYNNLPDIIFKNKAEAVRIIIESVRENKNNVQGTNGKEWNGDEAMRVAYCVPTVCKYCHFRDASNAATFGDCRAAAYKEAVNYAREKGMEDVLIGALPTLYRFTNAAGKLRIG